MLSPDLVEGLVWPVTEIARLAIEFVEADLRCMVVAGPPGTAVGQDLAGQTVENARCVEGGEDRWRSRATRRGEQLTMVVDPPNVTHTIVVNPFSSPQNFVCFRMMPLLGRTLDRSVPTLLCE